jgi:hypothetical protein
MADDYKATRLTLIGLRYDHRFRTPRRMIFTFLDQLLRIQLQEDDPRIKVWW